jgi:site-specific DNA-methyltransferase (adenine-specific)
MPAMADRSVDVVVTDPPYSEHVHSKSRRGLTVTHVGGAKDEISERRDLGFDSIAQDQMESAADQFARLARRWVLVFCDVESSHLWRGALVSAGLEYLRTAAWLKLGGAPQFTGDRPAVGFEAIVVAHQPGKKCWNGGGKAGIYSVPTAIDRNRSGLDARVHTTQKPVALMEALVLDFTDPGETILDQFAGSGTTGVAALRLGRGFIGFERDEKYHALATERLVNTRALPVGYHGAVAQGSLL